MNTIRQERLDLIERAFLFAKEVRVFVRHIPRSLYVFEDIRQVLRSSGSVGANLIEANEALSFKDRVCRLKICRKEAKETVHWLRLLERSTPECVHSQWKVLVGEAGQFVRIFSTIIAGYPQQ